MQNIIEFDIPAQSLEQALDAYSTLAGVQIVVDANLVSGLRSTVVKGTFAPPVALSILISGTGLAVHTIDDQGVTFVRAPYALSASVGRFERYSAAIQETLRSTLCQRPETAPGSYRALMRLWINNKGAVFRSELVTSSGSEVRDAELSKAMQTLIPGQPPDGLPQPITLLVTPDQASTAYCKHGEPTLHRDAGLTR